MSPVRTLPKSQFSGLQTPNVTLKNHCCSYFSQKWSVWLAMAPLLGMGPGGGHVEPSDRTVPRRQRPPLPKGCRVFSRFAEGA